MLKLPRTITHHGVEGDELEIYDVSFKKTNGEEVYLGSIALLEPTSIGNLGFPFWLIYVHGETVVHEGFAFRTAMDLFLQLHRDAIRAGIYDHHDGFNIALNFADIYNLLVDDDEE